MIITAAAADRRRRIWIHLWMIGGVVITSPAWAASQ